MKTTHIIGNPLSKLLTPELVDKIEEACDIVIENNKRVHTDEFDIQFI